MKKIAILTAVLALCVACDRDETQSATIACGGYEVAMQFDTENAEILHAVINGDTLDLAQEAAASGARYRGVLNDTVVVLWERGADWTLMLDEDMIIECNAK